MLTPEIYNFLVHLQICAILVIPQVIW